jgi:hypothetical protein
MTPHLALLANELKYWIADFLPKSDLCRIARCNKSWAKIAINVLYKRDARHGNSRAITWAAAHAPSDMQLSRRILATSLYHNGDINAVDESDSQTATALHYAAAVGSAEFVETLLGYGACPDARCSGAVWYHHFDFTRGAEHELPVGFQNLKSQILTWTWSPLALPIMLNDMATANALFDGGASAVVMQEPHAGKDGSSPGQVTIYHLIASMDRRRFGQWVHVFDHDNIQEAINAPLDRRGTLLHIAMEMGNDAALQILLRRGADVNIANAQGRSTLSVAIYKSFQETWHRQASRKVRRTWFFKLLNAGAQVDGWLLDFAVQYLMFHRSRPIYLMRLIKEIVQRGADVNWRNPGGSTILQDVCDTITTVGKSAALERLAEFLIDNGGDLNLPPAPGTESVILKSIRLVCAEQKVSKFHKTLLKAGARVQPHEVNWTSNMRDCRIWLQKNKHRVYHEGEVDMP